MPRAHHSQSLERGLAILAAFQPGRALLGITDLARRLDLNAATVHRYVTTLTTLGYLQQDPASRRYQLGPRALDLGLAALGSIEVREVASPLLRTLSDRTGHTVNMAILNGTDIVYVERVRSANKVHQAIDLDLHVGSRLPAYSTAMGKVMLADLPAERLERLLAEMELVRIGPKTITDPVLLRSQIERARSDGYAVCDEEGAVGLRAIAAPIRVHTGEVVAAIAVHAHRGMLTLGELVTQLGPQLRNTASEISALAGFRPQDGL